MKSEASVQFSTENHSATNLSINCGEYRIEKIGKRRLDPRLFDRKQQITKNNKPTTNNLKETIMKKLKFIALYILVVASIFSCSSDDSTPKVINQEEVITDVSLSFSNEAGEVFIYSFTDPQYRAEDYVAPVISLESGKTYQVEANFYNISNPEEPELLTEEIQEERDDHFLTYDFTEVHVDLSRTDGPLSTDSDGVQIGLSTQWIAGEAGNGTLILKLIHQATEKITTPAEGSFTGGETDVQVIFEIEISE